MAPAMRVMIILVIILGISASVQARKFPNNHHHSGAAMKVIQIAGVSSHAHDWFISIIYGDYNYVRSANVVGRVTPSPPPPQDPSGPHPVGRPHGPLPPPPHAPTGPQPVGRPHGPLTPSPQDPSGPLPASVIGIEMPVSRKLPQSSGSKPE